jgi:DeoR/GlpR family transcriptional regulator of sugar metabolism
MSIQKRQNRILEILTHHRDMTVEGLANMLGTSIHTVYKDLQTLEKNNKIQKTYGEVKIIELEEGFYVFNKRYEENSKIKRAITREALKLVSNGETIAIDSSTTTYHIVHHLIGKSELKLNIITNSVLILREEQILKNKNYNIMIIGGIFDRNNCCLIGADPQHFLPKVKINKFFFSTYGFSVEHGVMDSFAPQQILIKEFFYNSALESYCLIGSDKFKINGTYNWLNIDRVKNIITDSYVDKNVVSHLKKKGINIYIAKAY